MYTVNNINSINFASDVNVVIMGKYNHRKVLWCMEAYRWSIYLYCTAAVHIMSIAIDVDDKTKHSTCGCYPCLYLSLV